MFRFLHLADLHLDSVFACHTPPARTLLRQSLQEALARAVDCALNEAVDAVLIAGDLFDSERLSFATERFLGEQLSRLQQAGIDCVAVSGNHDPGEVALRAASVEWPQNFHYLRRRLPERIAIKRDKQTVAQVVGAGHETRHEEDNLTRRFPTREGSLPYVGLLHTQVSTAASAEQHARYAPCSPTDLANLEYDFWALGHIHLRQRIEGATEIWYPGNVQGRSPRERGPKGGLLVEVNGSAVKADFRAFSQVHWEKIKLAHLEEVASLTLLRDRAQEAFVRQVKTSSRPTYWFLIFELVGSCPLAGMLNDPLEREELCQDLALTLPAAYVEIRTPRLTVPVDVNALGDEPHLVSELLHLLEEAEQKPSLLEKLSLGIETTHLNPASKHRYLAELLDGLEQEAARRFFEAI